jgi:hypothetical protein
MKTKFMFLTIVLFLLSLTLVAEDGKIKETQFKVFGNCGMCKTRIEKAMKISEVKFAKWDKTTKMLKVAFDADAMTQDSLQKRLAFVGHDTEQFKAADSVYAALPPCCLYRASDKTH